jgi:hypothetical protein
LARRGLCYSDCAHVRFGKPQLIAAVLLLGFLLQCLWLMAHTPMGGAELQLHTSDAAAGPAANVRHSPLISLMATLPARALRIMPDASSPFWWLALRGAFMAMGTLLGATVWYIARRLYGNAGGYIALTLYCFSPAMIAHSSTVSPEIVAACGAFGLFWTAIATAHTLYAPREVVLWNWKRIVLLGVAIALGVGAQFSVALVAVIALAFMFYLVPHRMGAALAIMGAGCGIALALLFVVYGFRPSVFIGALRHGGWAEFSTETIAHLASWKMVGLFIVGNSAGLALLLVLALVTFAAWRHTRYFGTIAPLLTCFALVVIIMVMPRAAGFSFLIVMLPFALVFTAGVCVDLLEAENIAVRSLATGIIIAVLITHALFSVVALRHLSPAAPSGAGTPHAMVMPTAR